MAKITVQQPTVYDMRAGVIFTMHGYEGVYMVAGEADNGQRQVFELEKGQLLHARCVSTVTPYPDVEIILKART